MGIKTNKGGLYPMPEKEELTKENSISRRQFIKNTGIVVGGTAIGSSVLLSACNGATATETISKTVTSTVKVTTSIAKFVCPYDSIEFDSFAALQAHVESAHEAGDPVVKYLCPYDNQEFSSLADLKAHLEAEHLEAVAPVEGLIVLKVNGHECHVQVKPEWSLAFVLREKLGLPALKVGCDRGECGTCTVVANGRAIYSCCMLAMDADGMEIETVEGLSDGITLNPLQQSFVDNSAIQCGYCTPGFLMAAKALLATNPNPTRYEVREALSGHICVCGNIGKTIDAVLSV
jgi:aerobic-type carbon monoxide dehydrogenase small subunit (CoxS/CutS family)